MTNHSDSSSTGANDWREPSSKPNQEQKKPTTDYTDDVDQFLAQIYAEVDGLKNSPTSSNSANNSPSYQAANSSATNSSATSSSQDHTSSSSMINTGISMSFDDSFGESSNSTTSTNNNAMGSGAFDASFIEGSNSPQTPTASNSSTYSERILTKKQIIENLIADGLNPEDYKELYEPQPIPHETLPDWAKVKQDQLDHAKKIQSSISSKIPNPEPNTFTSATETKKKVRTLNHNAKSWNDDPERAKKLAQFNSENKNKNYVLLIGLPNSGKSYILANIIKSLKSNFEGEVRPDHLQGADYEVFQNFQKVNPNNPLKRTANSDFTQIPLILNPSNPINPKTELVLIDVGGENFTTHGYGKRIGLNIELELILRSEANVSVIFVFDAQRAILYNKGEHNLDHKVANDTYIQSQILVNALDHIQSIQSETERSINKLLLISKADMIRDEHGKLIDFDKQEVSVGGFLDSLTEHDDQLPMFINSWDRDAYTHHQEYLFSYGVFTNTTHNLDDEESFSSDENKLLRNHKPDSFFGQQQKKV